MDSRATTAITIATGVGVGAVVLGLLKTAGILVVSGCFLGVGFWLSRKLTAIIEERWAMRQSNIDRLVHEWEAKGKIIDVDLPPQK